MIATNIRKEAREALNSKWFKAVIIILIQSIIIGIITGIENLFDENSLINCILSIVEFIIEIPLAYGIIVSFMKLKRNEDVNYFDFIKIGFSNFTRSWKICLRTLVKMIIPIISIVAAIALVTIMFSVGGFAGLASDIGAQALWIMILGIIIYVIAISYTVIIGLKYSLTVNIAYDNPDMSAKEVVEKSEKLMIGHRGDLFVLILSFLGWAVLCSITLILAYTNILVIPLFIILGIGAVVGILCLTAYIQMARVCFYDDILQLNSEKNTEIKE